MFEYDINRYSKPASRVESLTFLLYAFLIRHFRHRVRPIDVAVPSKAKPSFSVKSIDLPRPHDERKVIKEESFEEYTYR